MSEHIWLWKNDERDWTQSLQVKWHWLDDRKNAKKSERKLMQMWWICSNKTKRNFVYVRTQETSPQKNPNSRLSRQQIDKHLKTSVIKVIFEFQNRQPCLCGKCTKLNWMKEMCAHTSAYNRMRSAQIGGQRLNFGGWWRRARRSRRCLKFRMSTFFDWISCIEMIKGQGCECCWSSKNWNNSTKSQK